MTGIVVTNDPVNPGQQPYARGPVHIKLVTGTDGGAGYTSAGSIIGTFTTQTDASGNWSATLTPNSQLTPANTHYEVTEGGAVSPIVVPDSGGPYILSQVLVTDPPTPAAPGMTGLRVAVNGATAGTRQAVNLIAGANTAINAVDDPGSGAVDVTFTASGGSGSGTVTSVNNVSPVAGNVELVPGDIGALSPANIGPAGSGSAIALVSTDPTTTNARTPTAHAASHASAGSDPVTPASIGAVDTTSSQNIGGVKAFTSSPTAPDPTAATQLATKQYADSIAAGLSAKTSVRLATAAALPANTYSNGASGLGATLTGNATGVLTVDGSAVALGDRVLVQNEAATANNGIYQCTTAGAVGVAYVLTRTLDMDLPVHVPGAFVFTEAGAVNTGAGFVVAGNGPYVIGTTPIVWTQFSGAGEIQVGAGLSKTGNTISLTARLDQIAAPTAAVGLNAQKITALANGTVATDAAAFGQIPVAGTGAGNYAAGNDTRITGALQAANNLGDVSNVGTARGNLGLYVQDSPAERGWVEWNYPILPQVAVSQNLATGTAYCLLFKALSGNPFSKVAVQVLSSASSPVAGQNLIGYYEIAGTLATQKGVTADLASWGAAGLQSYSIGAQSPAVGTTVALLLMSNATTPVHLQGVTSDTATQVSFLNLGLSNTAAPFLRFSVFGTGQTGLPASFTISGTTMTATNALVPFAALL